MRIVKLAFAVLTATLALGSAAAQAAGEDDIARTYGVWRNPHDTVHLEIKDCGPSTCGIVVWASAKAQADARKSGSDTLIGQQLLRDFEPQKAGGMRGKVYVPTLKMTFQGTAELLDGKTMKAKGCVIGNLLCKSQVWTRIDSGYNMASRAAP
ncbi:DUF2147 domain-containing protein [Caulobacter sp.]|uniref:DUF2147 domain-containing protein n=1 Tax=Caulobacter sp. TaxID=78 RepID=UPI003BAA611E